MIALPRAPFPITARELWLPASINGNASLPASVEGGHGLTLTGARKGTTADGVRGDGSATSNINAGANAIDNASAKYWVSLRFRLDQNWAAGSGDQYIWGKFVDATHYIRLKLDSATGNLIFEKDEGGATFSLSIASPEGTATWNAGTWYQALCSISDTAGARFKVNDAGLQTDADLNPMPNGGDLCFLDFDDPGAGTGFEGVEADVFCGNDNLTGAEETELYKGIPPADAVHSYPLDEGRGTTAYDRGSGADNGALDTSAIWKFGQVEQPVLSLDGINDHGQSAAGVDITGALTVVWVGKLKSVYDALVLSDHDLWELFIDNNTNYYLGFNPITDEFRFQATGGGDSGWADFEPTIAIDDYAIIISTQENGRLRTYFNGLPADSGNHPWTGSMPGLAATAYIGAEDSPAYWDVSKPLLVGVFDGAFTAKQARAFSRWMKNIFNLPISI